MPPATLSATARRHMMAAASWIAGDSPKASRRFQMELREALALLGSFPMTGASRPEHAPEPYRSPLPGFPHVRVYNCQRRPPVIMRILHGSRDLPEILSTLPSVDDSAP
ncbi:type II toxin-antitoxin system RelE/ParE family toxin [Caulobacter flavus]|uniref:Type II toxin-antitoxin system RelE/ParE family toxin n=1 Tax=Caulobacter flavus TaxID=1679497 RepID=A0A2N5D644_9CAUL|nr:type II toxin-antitoxin system RelE/ParE family toxin [Caulobacter flavus]AYV45922.1 type II toxin-antitoxin system RelE/ParE family toxin [Caulobacter flavus]PLR21535.1 type II toxin-antitoxin system RelE/ParE family toxin [Caulobacter flavus]